jgi:hypothetical protein
VRTLSLCLFLVCLSIVALAQEQRIRIKDGRTKAPVPFAAIRLGSSNQGVIADLDGLAILPAGLPDGFIEISALGYESRKVQGRPDSIIYLQKKSAALREVVVTPDNDKLRRIIRNTIARRDAHNPEHYPWYRCKVYYKMLVDAYPKDSTALKDTSKDAREVAAFLESQHVLISETYSRRSYRKPQKLQEEILATRFSGFKSPMFTTLVTDVLPFHCYTDYLRLNGKDFRNPLSAGSGQWFTFNLHDELLQGTDTLWIISFFPKKQGNALRGLLYITSRDYAVANFVGSYADSSLGSSIRIEQRYTEVSGKWFPHQLNYVYHLSLGPNDKKDESGVISMQGTSRIDSVSFEEAPGFHFDKVHTIKLDPAAGNRSDSAWQSVRPDMLDRKEARTYVFMDSLMGAIKVDRFMPYLAKLVEAKVPIGLVDINLERLYRYNSYEGSRPGLGLQTNDKISSHFSLGAWAGYGFHDAHWKWGGFAEAYLDAYKESLVRLEYEHDLRDPGRVRLHPELDNNYLRNYLITRADLYDAYMLSLQRRFGYLGATLSLRHESVVPQYDYAWNWEGHTAKDYTADELSLRLRYAFAERSAPLFGKYFSTGSRYPVLYANICYGMADMAKTKINYVQMLAAAAWQKPVARLGLERWVIEAGKLWSDAPLPIGKLFAGPGMRNDDNHFYLFGGLLTAYPYAYFADAFVSGSWRHEFDWRLFKLDMGTFSSMPGLGIQYNGFWGTLSNRNAQNTFAFSVPDEGYHEAGILMRDLLRLRYLHLYYFGITCGYFYPLQPSGQNAGSFVGGLNISL